MADRVPEHQGHHGVGLGLRWSILDEVLERPDLDIDFFEISPENYMRRGGYFPEALSEVAQDYAIRTHGLMMNLGGPTGPTQSYLDALKAFLDELGVQEHSDHLCWSGAQGQILHDLLPIPCDRPHARRVVEQIKRAQDHLGRPLAVENISYYGHLGPGDALCEADFVATVLEQADCQLLLDVNNVWVNAQNHGFDPLEYLQRLPLHRVVEIHVAGAERLAQMQDLWIDTHGADILPEVLALMQWVVARRGPLPVLYERDHDIPPLDDLLKSVATVRAAYQKALRTRLPLPHYTRRPLDQSIAPPESQISLSQAILQPPKSPASTQAPMLAPRVQVYRQLVNNGLRGVCRRFLPRCAHRRGAAWNEDLQRWLAGPGPRSSFLRDLPQEFVDFITPHWQQEPGCPPYLSDLARHELIEFAVESVPESSEPVSDQPLGLSDTLVFSSSACLLEYDYAVHQLAEDTEDERAPAAIHTVLLAYRDLEHEVRFLALSPMAHGLVSRLLGKEALGQAVLAQAAEDAELLDSGQVNDAYLQRVLTLLSDLTERGALRGPALPATPGA